MTKPIFVMPHYIATTELRNLAIDAMKSMKATADIILVSVDDGSPQDTGFLHEYSDTLIRLSENSGFAKACNAGLEWALEQDVQYIGCANNDIEVYEGWLEALIEPFDKFTGVGITGIVHSKDRNEAKRSKGRKITEGGLLNGRMQNGGLWLSTKEVLDKVGIFDEQFEIGGEEDVDLFLRLRDTYGYYIVMSDKSMFWHKEGATRWNEEIQPGYVQRNREAENRNHNRFAKKWGFDIRTHGLRFYEEVLED